MSTTTTEAPPHRSAAHPTVISSRGWALAGLAAGIAGIIGMQASLAIDAVYDPETVGSAERISERLGEQVPQLLVLHVAMTLATVLLAVFAAGLRRRLKAQGPVGSLLPDVAASGLLLTSVATLMGSGLTTEIVFGVSDEKMPIDQEFAAVVGHWVGTIPWLWLGAGLTGVALAVAALRHGAAPRWLGWTSAVLGGLTLLLGLSPLQYMAGFTGPVLVLLLGVGFAVGDRTRRSAS